MAVTDTVGGPFTPPGFYYKTFIRPRRLWPLYEKVLRHAAGLGKLRGSQDEREWRTEYRRRHADVLVVGGGLAGLRAAIAAAEAGADVVLADEGPEPGGRALFEDRGRARARARAGRAGPWRRRGGPLLRLRAGLLRRPRPRLAGLDAASGARPAARLRHRRRRAAARVRRQRPARRDARRRRAAAVALYGLAPGTRAVIATTSDRGLGAALALQGAGVEVAAVADLRATPRAAAASQRTGPRCSQAGRVEAEAARPCGGPRRAELDGGERATRSSATCSSCRAARRPRPSLIAQAGGRTAYDAARGHFALGRAARRRARGGRRRRRTATTPSPRARAPAPGRRTRWAWPSAPPPSAERPGRAPRPARPCRPAVAGRRAREVLRLPVRGRDGEGHPPQRRGGLRLDRAVQALHDGDHGPLPGPHVPAARRAAHGPGDRPGPRAGSAPPPRARRGRRSRSARWPAGRSSPPSARPIHPRHRELGARVMWAGDWRRAYDYGDPQGEALAVHESRRADRRLDAGQAHRARAARRASSSTASTPTASPTSSPGASATAC